MHVITVNVPVLWQTAFPVPLNPALQVTTTSSPVLPLISPGLDLSELATSVTAHAFAQKHALKFEQKYTTS